MHHLTLLLIQTGAAFALGAIIGLERDIHGSPAGVRTYAAVCLGACVFGLISTSIPGPSPTRIAAQVVTGIGFLGAGVIFRQGATTIGLTTAATIWTTAAVGLAIAFKIYWVAIFTTFLIVCILSLNELPLWTRFKRKLRNKKKPLISNQ